MYYEQYLTIWTNALTSIGYSLAVVAGVSYLVSGLSLQTACLIVIPVAMIIINMGGLMYAWGISLNAVSLVNLVMVSNLQKRHYTVKVLFAYLQ